jgi:putative ABC transport system substrate-binding protein
MRRREFITLVGGAAAAWPLAARAQQPERTRRVGVLLSASENDPLTVPIRMFRRSLESLGWSEKRNLHIESRVTDDPSTMRDYALELANLELDVIVTYSTPSTAAIKGVAPRTPIVFVYVADPVGSGFVNSWARPGGMITGFTNFESSLGGKWLGLLREIAPDTSRFSLLFNPNSAASGAAGGVYLSSAKAAATQLGVELIVSPVYDDGDIEAVFRALASDGAVIVNPNVFTRVHIAAILASAAKYRVPAIYPDRFYANAGGLLSYGVEMLDLFRGAATYVDRILRGTRASDLPVQQPTKFELVINLKTARMLGLTVPPTLLARADEVIE